MTKKAIYSTFWPFSGSKPKLQEQPSFQSSSSGTKKRSTKSSRVPSEHDKPQKRSKDKRSKKSREHGEHVPQEEKKSSGGRGGGNGGSSRMPSRSDSARKSIRRQAKVESDRERDRDRREFPEPSGVDMSDVFDEEEESYEDRRTKK